MARLILAGGGGFGLELLEYVLNDLNSNRLIGWMLGGLLNDSVDCEVLRRQPEVPYLGTLKDYQPQPSDAVLIAVGTVAARQKMAAMLQARGVRLHTYVHPSALVSGSAQLADGVIVAPHSIINAGAVIEANALINVFCSVGHGARIGPHSVLSPYCSLSGDSKLGAGCFMGTRATLFPKVNLGTNCIVDAHSAVKQSTLDDKIISVRGQYLVLDNRLKFKR